MDLAKVLAQLHAELENLDAAIASLERIQQGSRRRGRPPEWLHKPRSAPERPVPERPAPVEKAETKPRRRRK
jgi:hypothetical protein